MAKYDDFLWIGSKNYFVQLTNYFPWKNYKSWSIAKYIKRGKKVLDVGCSSGDLIDFVRRRKSSKGFGIDISRVALKEAKKRYPKCTFKLGSAEKITFPSNHFDYVICYDLLEHVKHPEKVIKEMSRVLKKNGKLILEFETADRYSELLRKEDRKNPSKDSWIHGSDLLKTMDKHFTVKTSFYGGQAFMFYLSDRVTHALYNIPGFFVLYSFVELLLSFVLGRFMKGTWMFVYAENKK